MKILLVDDHELIREGLKKVLVKQSDMQVIGEAENSNEIFEKLSAEEPDIVILDISLPGRSGLDIIKDIKNQYPEIKILVLSMHPEERFAVRALKAGALGYLSKHTAASELVNALRKISEGRKYISSELAEKLANEIVEANGKPIHECLSNRELEVMRMISLGRSVGDIAKELCLSINTVTSYRSRILEKMDMKTNAEIIRYAIENQLIE